MNIHEKGLGPKTLDMNRAIHSLREELEAMDWYAQRIEACEDEGLQKILEHAAEEEKEHAAMLINWIAEHDKQFAEELTDKLTFMKKDSEGG